MSLTSQQLQSVKEGYGNIIVNSYTLEEAQQIIFDHICEELDELTEHELEVLIVDETDEQTYDDLVEMAVEDDNNLNRQL